MNIEINMTNKLVKESLNITFSRGGDDKISSLGIGKKKMIQTWLDEMNIFDYFINDDLTINCPSSICLPDNYGNLPDYIQFNEVECNCNFRRCKMTSLKGSPYRVGGSFMVDDNKLTSLEFAPLYCQEISILNYLTWV